jgi:hypothetical protein
MLYNQSPALFFKKEKQGGIIPFLMMSLTRKVPDVLPQKYFPLE